MSRPARRGFSLLEVLLATAILMGSAVVLFQLAALGRAHIESAEDLATAQRICESRLNEMLAGVTPIAPVEEESAAEDSDYLISVEVNPLEQMPGVSEVRVTVRREAAGPRRAKSYTLVRWIALPPAATSGSDSTSGEPTSASSSSPMPDALPTPAFVPAAPAGEMP